MYTHSEIDAIVEKAIINMNLKGSPEELYEPIEYLISIGGKRLRPKMSVMSFNLFSDNIDDSIIYPSLALEIFHGFTLIHDDIMDNSSLRRGQLTVHKKWDISTAILSGDVMCIKAYEYLAHAPLNKLHEVLSLFTKTATEVCEGQQLDMNFESQPFITTEDYIEMIGLKTAVLMACSAKMGAIIGGADKRTADAIYDFAYQLGLAFQIKDDYLDVYGNTSLFGKNIGGDIANNKKTWLLIEAFKRASGRDLTRLNELISKDGKIEAAEKIDEVMKIYETLNIKQAAESAISHYNDKALSSLDNSSLSNIQKDQLFEFAKSLINREK
ncbi:MAG: polyprenyl synthetase family protein [Bacteroidales bacterium]